MCGIFFSISHHRHVLPSEAELELLKKRGPDSCKTIQRVVHGKSRIAPHYLTFCSTVLSLRGTHLVQQPLQDPSSESLFCWNGEAWSYEGKAIEGNDAQVVFNLLLEAAEGTFPCADGEVPLSRALCVFSKISGPFAFLFYDARSQRIFFGRDVLGRRALLTTITDDGSILISSVGGDSTPNAWEEVEADGIHVIEIDIDCRKNITDITDDFSQNDELLAYEPKQMPWSPGNCDSFASRTLKSPFPAFNSGCPTSQPPILSLDSSVVTELADLLKASLSIRVRDLSGPPARSPTKLAILFSGGLDCTLLARLCHNILPYECEIDLLNVAFENPRVEKAAAGTLAQTVSAGRTAYSSCPDRSTGLNSHNELLRVCPERTWRFVSINVPYPELLAHRPQIQLLIRPQNTEMDLSIASALYFAARGDGIAHSNSTGLVNPYVSPARVLLSGLGADELFAGYTRHATAFVRKGYKGLLQELEFDFRRLGKRNLGRDDRVISHWGKEARYPYLDEVLVSEVLRMPVWKKCGFGQALSTVAENEQNPVLEPAKLVLRLLAWKLQMSGVAAESKRAIQFGARTAKMETGRTKGTQTLSSASSR